ncbi:MAG: beta-ketoacyl-[acyl-carrier-protein] synthase family protein, partial [Gemmatimonadetes bacterium]|nr:beta-ketoacyl-[acyl-carrier-protein] synthase family protein [Gemmatimonadota bacterium]
PFRSKVAIHVDDFDAADHLGARDARRLDRFGQFSVTASQLALEDASLDAAQEDPARVAVQMGSALGGISQAETQAARFLSKGVRSVDPRVALHVFPGAASCNVAIRFGFTGPNSTNAMSCASGTMAIGEAWRLIRDGIVDVALAGGAEAPLAPLSYGAFSIIRAMTERNEAPELSCRPFDAGRDGFVMGEGAAVLVLEEEERALARGARVYARISGYGNTNDAHHMTAPKPGGDEARRAMAQALSSAGVEPGDVDYVNAHGSSTPLNDSTESLTIRALLGAHADGVKVSGTKPFYGHALGASGAIEAAICALVLQRGWIPPTLNLSEVGEGCDLTYVRGEGVPCRPQVVLTNSFGFGGINASLVLTAAGPARPGAQV